ncbi:hypothetical protein [Thiofilum flexile]|uniref:hypothetical protein n=1 Tax=Thiofilum flexile TaxID=125627 RepID=UPI00036C1102|nr:hypothetical protein [Thiofilum flexile]
MVNKLIIAITLIAVCSMASAANAQAVQRTVGGTCYAFGKAGTYIREPISGKLWCRVGTRESECGGVPDLCSDPPPPKSQKYRAPTGSFKSKPDKTLQ